MLLKYPHGTAHTLLRVVVFAEFWEKTWNGLEESNTFLEITPSICSFRVFLQSLLTLTLNTKAIHLTEFIFEYGLSKKI